MKYDLIIIGSGAAGLSAALYARRYKMETLVIEGEFGGETATAGAIENYPGILFIDGFDLVKAMQKQAKDIGAVFEKGKAEKISSDGNCFTVKVGEKEFQGNTVILAIGSQRRHLGLPNEKELTGKGVHYCVTCDGPVYSGKTVAMVGGGDSSVKGVNFLSEYAKKIYLIVRGKEVMAEPVNLERMKAQGNKVEVLLETEVAAIMGEKFLEKLVLSKEYKGSRDLKVDGMFVEVGFDPDKTFAEQLGIELDEKGYMKVDNLMKTNVPGVFAAGDTTNHFGRFKQDITAAALGSVAATSAYEYHQTHGDICELHGKVPDTK
ncbi:FAD-dependent oxidoreductase [Patescibacteria group bacterium]|nr:FAD-dependent oxidoreductase [Patescibacteria group bacterium]